MKLITRAALGWPASAAPTQATTKGVKVHYEGAPVSARLLADHSLCIAEWRNIRASHLANTAENYSDVAYNYAACVHGYLLEGRGIGRRTGANGNQALNQAHYAIVGLVGSSGLTVPTDAMLHAIRDGIELLRRNGAGTEIKGHRDGYATACPGGPLYAWVQKGAPRPAGATPPTPTPPKEIDMPLTTADVKKLLQTDNIIKAPTDAADVKTNPHWTLQSHVQEQTRGIRSIEKQVTALTAVNRQLVDTVARLAADVGDLDPAAIVTELTQAIESIDVRLDVTTPAS